MLGNPVPGTIQPHEEPWKGPPTFRVTSTFAQHVASGRGPGIDFGNGSQGAPVLAMYAGKVSLAGWIGSAKVIRLIHPGLSTSFGGKEVGSGYAHLATIGVSIGQTVSKGQPIGTVGMTGADAPHLHGGFTVAGVERDFWPLLDQNMEDDVSQPTIPATKYTEIVNRTTTLAKQGSFYPAPVASGTPILVAAGTEYHPINTVRDAANNPWYGGFILSKGFWHYGYFPRGVLNPFLPEENPPDSADSLKAATKKGATDTAKAAADYAASLP